MVPHENNMSMARRRPDCMVRYDACDNGGFTMRMES